MCRAPESADFSQTSRDPIDFDNVSNLFEIWLKFIGDIVNSIVFPIVPRPHPRLFVAADETATAFRFPEIFKLRRSPVFLSRKYPTNDNQQNNFRRRHADWKILFIVRRSVEARSWFVSSSIVQIYNFQRE